MRTLPTIDRLRQVLSYDPVNGVLRWISPHGGRQQGKPAGTKCRRGYITVKVDGTGLQAHRVAWLLHNGAWPTGEIDHIDHDPSNNQIDNLRDVSRRANHENRVKARAGSRTGLLGARYDARRGNFFSEIKVDGRPVYLGSFDRAELAHEAYVAAKRKHHAGCTL